MNYHTNQRTISARKLSVLLTIGVLALVTSQASAADFFTTYTGSQEGVTVRDQESLTQSIFIDTGLAQSQIATGPGDILFVAAANSIYRYNTAGTLLSSFTFPDPSIVYTGIDVAEGNVYVSYRGSQQGVSVRDQTTLQQSTCFSTLFSPTAIAAGKNSDLFLASGNSLYQYNLTGLELNSFTFPDPAIVYTGVSVDDDNLYCAYTGAQTGVSVRYQATLVQSLCFSTPFSPAAIAAGPNSDLFLTSSSSLYLYDTAGVELSSFTFPIGTVSYVDVAVEFDGCNTLCGDCNGDGNAPSILDALLAAQMGAGVTPPASADQVCCDVNASGSVGILDALLIAKAAAGMVAPVTCPQ